MRMWFHLLLRRLTYDWWRTDTRNGKWGVYHPTRRHLWNYPYATQEEAATERRRLNEQPRD